MTKRTVFTQSEIKCLSESPEALTALAGHHYAKDTESDASGFEGAATFHNERAHALEAEATRLAALYDDGEGPDYNEASQLVTGMHIQDLIDFCTDQASLYSANLTVDLFNTGYHTACERFVKKLKELDGTYLERRDSNGNLLFTYASVHKGEFTHDPIPFELEISDLNGHGDVYGHVEYKPKGK
jgi:hypothetical protein